jgi:type IV pilus assembly protein PilZ
MPQSSERRQRHRAPIELRVEYQRLNRFFYDYTRNISMGGTFIKTSKPLAVGTQFLFKLMIPTLAEPLVLRGEVRWILHEGEVRAGEGPDGADEPGMGIRFIYDNDEQRAEVEREVEKLMVGSLGPRIYASLQHKHEHEGEDENEDEE